MVIVKVTNKNGKPLTKNQKKLAILFIVLGVLFVFNEFIKRVNLEEEGAIEGQKAYCDRLLKADIHLYTQDERCNK